MLTIEEAKYNFIAIQFGAFMNFLPFKLIRASGSIRAQSKWRWRFFVMHFVLALLYNLNFIRTLIQSKLSKEKIPINHFANHTSYSLGMTSDLCRVAAYFFVQNEIVVVFNELYNSSTMLGKKRTVYLRTNQMLNTKYGIRNNALNFHQEVQKVGERHVVSGSFQDESYLPVR